jgi:deoxyadenosine/deoxycytidine kinase
MSKIFVSGPSGVGKTTLGETLSKKYGWFHLDCEKMHKRKGGAWLKDPTALIPKKQNLILTWGLIPSTFSSAEKIIDSGFTYIWIDGDLKYIEDSLRKRGEEEEFINDPQREQGRSIFQKRNPDRIIEAFDRSGSRIDLATIINEVYRT